jgi:prephenate dehydratase
VPQQPFNYRFYVDAELADVQQLPALVAALTSATAELRLFGAYPLPPAGV